MPEEWKATGFHQIEFEVRCGHLVPRRYETLNTITWPTGADLAAEFLYGSVVDDRAATS